MSWHSAACTHAAGGWKQPCQVSEATGTFGSCRSWKNEGRQREWIQGMERKVLGRSGCTMVLVLVQLQGFIILNDITGYRNIKVVIWD